MKRTLRAVAVVALIVLAYPTWLGLQVWQQSREDEVHSADAIVVSSFGDASLNHSTALGALNAAEAT